MSTDKQLADQIRTLAWDLLGIELPDDMTPGDMLRAIRSEAHREASEWAALNVEADVEAVLQQREAQAADPGLTEAEEEVGRQIADEAWAAAEARATAGRFTWTDTGSGGGYWSDSAAGSGAGA
jgi:hypothetical protein